MKRFYIILIYSFLCCFCSNAQVVNTGQTHLSNNTVAVMNTDFINREEGVFYNDGQLVFRADFINNGRYDFLFPGGSTSFNGNQPQQLLGQHPSYFSTLIFNNTSVATPFHLHTVFSIAEAVNFLHGIILTYLEHSALIFEQHAKVLQVSNASFVDGAVNKLSAQEFVFPVGDRQVYRPLKITSFGKPQGIQVLYLYKELPPVFFADLPTEIIKVDRHEYWRITKFRHAASVQLVTLSFAEQTTPPDFIAAAKAKRLCVVRWDDQLKQWRNLKGSVDFSTHSITAKAMREGIYTFGIAAKSHTPCSFKVFNLVDVHGQGKNKWLRIHPQSDCVRDFSVTIFNRWGVKVFQTNHYGIQGEVFSGYASDDVPFNRQAGLPTGTYFYIINYHRNVGNLERIYQQVGYVFLKN